MEQIFVSSYLYLPTIPTPQTPPHTSLLVSEKMVGEAEGAEGAEGAEEAEGAEGAEEAEEAEGDTEKSISTHHSLLITHYSLLRIPHF
ncbi:MAG: hypothetical protein F6K41_32740 [Symploca sp. SIO3E6]|nr:hypothetical protein [Caldora sp. SIO3E6]